jgi:hypothetical protein
MQCVFFAAISCLEKSISPLEVALMCFSVVLQFVRITSNVYSALKSYVLELYYPQYLVNMGLLAFTGFVHVSCVCNSMNIMRY